MVSGDTPVILLRLRKVAQMQIDVAPQDIGQLRREVTRLLQTVGDDQQMRIVLGQPSRPDHRVSLGILYPMKLPASSLPSPLPAASSKDKKNN